MLFLFSLAAFAQPLRIGIHAASRASAEAPPVLAQGRTIEFENTTLLNGQLSTYKVIEDGELFTGEITVPEGYSAPHWYLRTADESNTVVAEGIGKDVSASITYTSGRNVYHLQVTTTRSGYPDLDRYFYGEITCVKDVFTEDEADLVIDLTGETGQLNYDGSWTTDRPGYKIFVKGSCTGCRFNPYYWRSSQDDNPVTFQFDNVTITNSTFNFTPGPCENVIFNGLANPSVEHGIKLVKSSGSDQCFILTSSDGTRGGRRYTFLGIHVDNGSNSIGGTGIQVSTSDATNFNYSNYVLEGVIFKHCKVENTRDEGFYILHFTDFDDNSNGRRHAPGSDFLIFDNDIGPVGNEGIQFGSCFDCEVFGNRISNWGTRNESAHRNAIQWSGGNQNSAAYANLCIGQRNLFTGFTGQSGLTNEIFSNVWYTTGKVSAGVNFMLQVQENNTDDNLYWGIFNNTAIIADGIPYSLYNATGGTAPSATVFDPLVLANNIIITNTATHYETFDGFDDDNLIEGDLQETDVDDIFFFDRTTQTASSYRLATTASPAFTTLTSFTPSHRFADRDFDGVKFLADHPVKGAFSGYELFTGETITRNISSAAAISDVEVSNGTSFATLVASHLPATGLITNEDGSTRRVEIDWQEGDYDGDVEDTYSLTGIPTSLPSDITNTDAVTFSVNVDVGPALDPYNVNISFGSTTNQTGWLKTGSTSPYPGSNTNVTFNPTNGSGATDPDIQVIAVNSSNTTRWNQIISQTVTFSGTPNSVSIPSSVSNSVWNTDANAGTPRVGTVIIQNKTGGSQPFTGRLCDAWMVSTRSGTGVRNNTATAQGITGTPSSIDILGNTTSFFSWTDLVPTSGQLTFTITYNPTGSDGAVQAYLNAIILSCE